MHKQRIITTKFNTNINRHRRCPTSAKLPTNKVMQQHIKYSSLQLFLHWCSCSRAAYTMAPQQTVSSLGRNVCKSAQQASRVKICQIFV